MDFHHKEILKRYARMATGRPFAPILLNILITSVCDMRCVHCFFTDELDDKERKRLQMTTRNVEQVSETLGANLGVLIVAGGEPFTRKDLPEIARAFHKNNKLESIYLMSNGQIQQRIIPDVTRILQENPQLNVTVALGIDGLKEDHESIRQKVGKLGYCDRYRAQASADQEGISAAGYSDLHLLHEQQSGPDLRVVRLPEVRSEARQGQHQLHSSAFGPTEGTHHRQDAL